jgi:hypothetical protein
MLPSSLPSCLLQQHELLHLKFWLSSISCTQRHIYCRVRGGWAVCDVFTAVCRGCAVYNVFTAVCVEIMYLP